MGHRTEMLVALRRGASVLPSASRPAALSSIAAPLNPFWATQSSNTLSCAPADVSPPLDTVRRPSLANPIANVPSVIGNLAAWAGRWLMAVPKKKTSHSKSRIRRNTNPKSKPKMQAYVQDQDGRIHPPHRAVECTRGQAAVRPQE